jgi:hypothetical protein
MYVGTYVGMCVYNEGLDDPVLFFNVNLLFYILTAAITSCKSTICGFGPMYIFDVRFRLLRSPRNRCGTMETKSNVYWRPSVHRKTSSNIHFKRESDYVIEGFGGVEPARKYIT